MTTDLTIENLRDELAEVREEWAEERATFEQRLQYGYTHLRELQRCIEWAIEREDWGLMARGVAERDSYAGALGLFTGRTTEQVFDYVFER